MDRVPPPPGRALQPTSTGLAARCLNSCRPKTAFLSVWDAQTEKCDFLLASKSFNLRSSILPARPCAGLVPVF